MTTDRTYELKQPIHGNYHAYYNKRPNAYDTDPRLEQIPQDIFKGKRVLDIGCNEGWLAVDIAQRFSPSKVIGVDLDGDLIAGAWKRRRAVWSLQEPPHKQSAPVEQKTEPQTTKPGQKRKRTDTDLALAKETRPGSPIYFPAALQHMFGPLPIPSSTQGTSSRASHTFPNNMSFYTVDWMAPRDIDMSAEGESTIAGIEREDREGYDVAIAFSITKWIHLHGGDEGLLAFFRKIHTVLRPGGVLLLEPQGWENYAKAKKLTPTLSETYKTLQLRPSEFPTLLRDIGFKEMGSYAEEIHKRAILAFKKV